MGIPSDTFQRLTDLVVQFQATPVCLELLKTVFAHLADTIETNERKERSNQKPHGQSLLKGDTRRASQVNCASGYPSTLLQTVSRLSVFRLAKHKVLYTTHTLSQFGV